MSHQIRQRLNWVELYEQTGDAGLVCRRCGISRPTLRMWYRRWKKLGDAGLENLSRRPHNSPAKKVSKVLEEQILELRKRRLGVRRIRSELLRLYDSSLALATVQKVLVKHSKNILVARKIKQKGKTRYQCAIPGQRVQMDICKIAPGVYQYAAIDDCTRMRILAVYARKTVSTSIKFLEFVLDEIPFPIQRVQTDRGGEFFGQVFQQRLMDYAIKFRPIKPGSPHLNGKVERSQKTDLEEFWATISIKGKTLAELQALLTEWQIYYNHERPHSSLKDQTPWEKWWDLGQQTPLHEEVEAKYDQSKERFQEQNYQRDLQLKKVKGSV